MFRSRPSAEGRSEDDDELGALLHTIRAEYGLDFSGYTPATSLRRLRNLVQQEGLSGLPALGDRLTQDGALLNRVLSALAVNVTTLFRNPPFFAALRERVVPFLKTLPFVRVWSAGCSTGEEAYSLAILLLEEGLLERSRIYATDINPNVLARASEGIYPETSLEEFAANHQRSGGRVALTRYYSLAYGHARFHGQLRRRMVFAQHNLATDASFQEFHLILCRNVLIYFEPALQARVHRLLLESLSADGFLGLGHGESVRLTPVEEAYEEQSPTLALFRRR